MRTWALSSLLSGIKKFSGETKASPVEKIMTDKYGNEIHLCEKCNVPIVTNGAVIRCLNGCYIGSLNLAPNEPSSAENKYNPRLWKICSKCKGDGKEYFREDGMWCAKICEQCSGERGFWMRKYTNEEEDALAHACLLDVNNEGWTKCPRCNFKFQVQDKNVWIEDRHRRCGQKLILPDTWRNNPD